MEVIDSMRRLKWRGVAFALAAGLLASFAIGCGGGGDGGDGTDPNGGAATTGQPVEPSNKAALAQLRGDIVIDGSSTVYPVTQAAAEEFATYANNVRISVGIAGTGGGFKKFCNGETDIQDASRPISSSELTACNEKSIDFIELPVAYDGLALVVSPRNTWATCLTKAELKKIWEPAAQGQITNWKQVRDSFPDKPLKLFGAGTDSGTFDYFTEAINGTAKASRGDYQASEDDNVLVQGVSTDENALGYFGLAYYTENASKLKLVAVDDKGDGKCVQPSIQTVNNGTYQPLSRPIFIYVRKSVAERPEVKAFINFYLSKSFTPLVQSREVGYVALDDRLYEAILKRFNAGTVGTLFPKGAEVGATLDRYVQA
jgi:phosphate transport system substrate-binding protein